MTEQGSSHPGPNDAVPPEEPAASSGWSTVPVPDPMPTPDPAAEAFPPPPPVEAFPPAGATGAVATKPAVELPGYGWTPLASMIERILGAVIDAFIMVVPIIVLAVLLPNAIDVLAGTLVSAAYVITMIGRRGATIGGRLMRIKCVTVAGGVPGYTKASQRWALLYLPNLIPVVGFFITLVVGLSPLFDANRRMQGFQDKIAGTYVVKTDAGSPVQQER